MQSVTFFIFSLIAFWLVGMVIMVPLAWGMVVNKGDERPLTVTEKDEIKWMIGLSWISIAGIIMVILDVVQSDDLKKDFGEELEQIRKEDGIDD